MKKGQVTIFIILGILLLILIFLGIYLSAQRAKEALFEEAIIVPEQAKPVHEFVEACLQQTAKDALITIGEHGGYANIGQLRANPFNPTGENYNAVQFSPLSSLRVPYWWYMRSENSCEKTGTCTFASQRPKLFRKDGSPSIEEELDWYINRHIMSCLRNFEPFREQGISILPEGEPEATSRVTAMGVLFRLRYPLKILRPESETRIDVFASETQLNLMEIYNTAVEIVNKQATHQFIEKHTRNLIDLFSRREQDSLPPPSDVSVLFGERVVWVKPIVKRQLQEILASYVPMLQAAGTINYNPVFAPADIADPELYEIVYNRNMLVPLETAHPSIAVHFAYLPQWEPYFDLNCDGDTCGPESFSTSYFIMALFGIHKYHFAYDLSYPLLVELQSPFAFAGSGYSFKLFVEANMRNNVPLTLGYVQPDYAVFEAEGQSLFCSPSTWNSGTVTVSVTNGESNLGADGISIAYRCGNDFCTIGETENGELESKFPRCLGGELMATHPDFPPSIQRIDTGDASASVDIVLEPYRFKNIEIRPYLYKRGAAGQWSLDEANLGYLQESEEATLILQMKNSEFMTSATQSGPGLFEEAQNVRILPGSYDVQAIAIDRQRIVIPAEERCTEGECFDIEAFEFGEAQPFPKTTMQYEVVISKENLDKSGKIIFPIIMIAEDKIPQSERAIEDLQALGKLDELAKSRMGLLQPRFE